MRKFLPIVLCLTLGACQGKSGAGGNEGANGGDRVAQQAALVVSDVVGIVESASADFPEISIADLKAVAARVRIIIRDRTSANGVETDASNNGYDLIELNGSRWPKITDSDRRLALIFHELLGCMGLEKNSYALSSRLLSPENRFVKEQNFSCHLPSGQCLLSMRYDRTQKALIVADGNCGGFFHALTFFYKQSRKEFYYEKPCQDPDAPDEPNGGVMKTACSQSSAPVDFWVGITFLDGGRFFFSGAFKEKGWVQMSCFPASP